MKIGFFGDHIWAQKTLEKLHVDPNVELVFVCPRSSQVDDDLVALATKFGVDVLNIKKVNSAESIDLINRYKPDLLISVSYDQIIKNELINLPVKGFINCHAGKLPNYRGRNILNWALINDEKEFGITVHYIDEGIDTGDIIVQKTYAIDDEDSYNSLLEKAFEECPKLVHEAVSLIAKDEVQAVKQIDLGKGTYCRRRVGGDEIINWNTSSRDVFNFIRGITLPAVGASTFIKEKMIKLYDSRPVKTDSDEKPGMVLDVNKDTFTIKCGSDAVMIKQFDLFGVDLKKGDVLGN